MVRLHHLIFILLFLEFQTNLSSASQPTDNISSIIQSYADAFTTIKPEESQFVTTQFHPQIEVQDHAYVYNFTKPNSDNKPASSNVPLVVAASSPEITNVRDFSGPSVEESNESGDPKGPPDHVIPFSEHENPPEPSTRPNYTAPGDWAKPPPDKHIDLDFIPTKLYAQVRDSHVIKHVPRGYSAESAETSEEKENAARLREVVKESKANTIYTEEGYEDAAYDHAGHVRDADFEEGFDRKLNEELDRKAYSSNKKPPVTFKKLKPRKHRRNKNEKLTHQKISQPNLGTGTYIPTQQVRPEQLRVLKNALNQPSINPKINVENGIRNLERDLKKEYREVQRTSPEPYAYVPTTMPTQTFRPPATESAFQRKTDLETTTIRRNVFTIRPKKTITTVTPKPRRNKPKKPLIAHLKSKRNDNHGAYSTSSYSYEPTQIPTTIDYGSSVWGYLRQNQNATPLLTYSTPQFQHFEQQTVNPLAVATVNGHGPYLVVVTARPDTLTPNPLDNQNLMSNVRYDVDKNYNVSQPIVVDSINHHNGPPNVYKNTDVSKPASWGRGKMRHKDKKPKVKKLKHVPTSESNPSHFTGNRDSYMEYYRMMHPQATPNLPILFPNNQQQPFPSFFNQWPVAYEKEKLVASDGSDSIDRRPIEQEQHKDNSPMTKLYPPAPLSGSEYLTFHRKSMESNPITPTMMAIMPIIDAIHKREYEEDPFPFFLRRKRSTYGFFRPPNFKSREKKNQEMKTTEKLNNPSKSNSTAFPKNFHSLLNEAPKTAQEEIDVEIERHFDNSTKTPSGQSFSQAQSKEQFKEGDTVEVQVPPLDFTSVFEKDAVEPTTQKPRIDTKKYPFYKDSSAMRNTALKYVINPKEVPRKSLGGMEFYESRIRECEDVNPDLEKIVPEDEELANKRGPQKKKLRLHGLGDKIDCYKAKYFDEKPFDNPLFMEKDVKMPPPPRELNPKVFASRILELPSEREDYTIPKGPKKPEYGNVRRGVKSRGSLRYQVSPEPNVRHQMRQRIRKPNLGNRNRQRYRNPSKNAINVENNTRQPDTQPQTTVKTSNAKVVPRYQRLVYEDVMGNIMNLDKSKKSHVPKRGVTALHTNNYKRDNKKMQGLSGFQKLKTEMIEGLVPPPRKIDDKLVNDVLTKNLRIFKRSATLKEEKKISLKETNNEADRNGNSTFRIIFTTPQPNQTFTEITPRQSNRSEADASHYGRFLNNENSNSSFNTRRREPKYNIAKNANFAHETSKFNRDTTFASSTLNPVVVNLDNNTARLPNGNKNNQAKKQIAEKPDHNKRSSGHFEKLANPEEEEEDPKKQFVVFDTMQDKDESKSNGIVVTTYASTPNIQDHTELVEFLKGNPPGYDAAFAEEFENKKNKKKGLYRVDDEMSDVKEFPKDEGDHTEKLEARESLNNEEVDDQVPEPESENDGLDEQKSDTHGEERESDDGPDQDEETRHLEEDEGKKSNGDQQDDKPFVRFSSRPYSPPESYEDERYADLGPRINKPYFYHPPFDVPAYEKYAHGKPVDHSGDDYGHEQTEFHEKYVFPWEHDHEDENKDEAAEHHSELDDHEYPWEKRERREKEREKMHKKYISHSNYDDDTHGKASNMKLVYAPSINKLLRGKKDVTALQSNLENQSPKYSSKYKSDKKDVEADREHEDDIKKYVLKQIEDIEMSTPKAESVYTTRKNLKYIASENISSNKTNKNNETTVVDSNTQQLLTTVSPLPLERTIRMRGRTRRININNNKNDNNETLSSDTTELPKPKPTLPSSRITRQRSRNRGSTAASLITSSTSTTTAKPNFGRRRTRLTSSTTTARTVPKPVNEKRRRPFRVIQYPDRGVESTTLPTVSTSTGRTVERERRSRVSKETIITKTVEDDDNDDPNENSDKKITNRGKKKHPSRVGKIKHGQQYQSVPDADNASKKERVEKVTITMEETPDHVYKTKEIDKDGIKGKFVTITANNNTVKTVPTRRSRERTADVNDAEMEEMQRKMEAFKSFDSVVQDSEDSADEPSSLHVADKYVVGSLLQKLPLPLTRKLTGNIDDNEQENEDEGEDESEDEDEDEDEDDDGNDDEGDEDAEKEVNDNNEKDVDAKENPSVIKNPNDRNYYYVKTP